MSTEPQLRADTPEDVVRLRAELAEANRKLAEAFSMVSLGRLVSGIVHEINTPIGSILSNNEVILRSLSTLERLLKNSCEQGAPPCSKTLEVVETMRSLASVDKIACERISGVIRSLKTFARVDTGDLRKVDIHELILNALKICGCEFRRRISVETDFADLPPIECYPQRLSQVFLNLLVNASQAIEGEGKISVQTRREGSNVVIGITDTGRGIDAADKEKIFARGFSTKPIGEGTGLGLAIAREMIEDDHSGAIDFESTAGVGTTFYIRIPIEQPKTRPFPS
jgi:two-component system, NtrC family, sensor kinase